MTNCISLGERKGDVEDDVGVSALSGSMMAPLNEIGNVGMGNHCRGILCILLYVRSAWGT